MDIKDYFKKTKGFGVLSTADEKGALSSILRSNRFCPWLDKLREAKDRANGAKGGVACLDLSFSCGIRYN